MEHWTLLKHLSLLWLIMVIGLIQQCSGCSEKERVGLLQIKEFFYPNGAYESIYKSNALSSWVDNKASSCCGWELVKCNPLSGHVIELSLGNLRGRKPMDLLNVSVFLPFEQLRSLDLSFKGFDALVEETGFSSLKKLEILKLSYNNFNSSIFASLNGLSTLRTLSIVGNGIQEPFHGQDFANLTNLEILDLRENLISGALFGEGEIPKDLVNNCISLKYLKLSNNFLQGQAIPKSARWTKLEYLYLNNNNFSGKIEEELAHNSQLQYIDISNNSVSGKIPSSIWNCSVLSVLLMAENQLEGQIPRGLSNLTNLEILDLSRNKLSELEPELNFSSLELLKFLYLQKNVLSGSIPSTLSESSKLVTLDLRDNRFSGSIPLWINKLSKLRVLLLGGNCFRGHIPVELCQLRNISIIDLSRNKFSGLIPSCIANVTFGMGEYDGLSFKISDTEPSDTAIIFFNLNTSVKLSELQFPSMLQDEVKVEVEFRTKSNYYSYGGKILDNMTGLDLSSNELIGNIPLEIGYLQQIHGLNLSHNFLSGSIPNTFSNLTQIESLDLSYNNLISEIPSKLSQLYYLAIFNLSYNNLSGIPPSSGQFANFDENNYRGNPNLCGPLLRGSEDNIPSPVLQSDEQESKGSAVDMEAFSWSFAGSYVTILLGLVVVLCINVRWRLTWFYLVDKFIPSFFLQY